MSEAQNRASRKYRAKTYSNISYVIPKDCYDLLKAAADATGESLGEYSRNAVFMRMKAEGMPTEPATEQIPDSELEAVTGGLKNLDLPGAREMPKRIIKSD